MTDNSLKEEIYSIQTNLKQLEKRFNLYATEIEIREQRWKNCEKKLEELNKINDGTCTLNVGGKKYEVSLHTLKSKRGTIFYKQILRGEIKKDGNVFYDRDYTYFPVILNFLRTGKLKTEKMSDEQKDDLLNEALFYEVNYIVETLKATPQEVEITNIEVNEQFTYEEAIVGGSKLGKDLKDKSLTKGVCAHTPGVITLTLSREVEFEEIELGGYNGNSLAWYVSNGKGASISTSINKNNWTTVGTIPDSFGATICTVKCSKSKAKYIRFSHTDYLGIGYIDVKEGKKNK
jgi:hypothetical protein